nr:MAG TPA: hypothetical protein [Caudoviricetes sp.]
MRDYHLIQTSTFQYSKQNFQEIQIVLKRLSYLVNISTKTIPLRYA